MDFMKSFVDDVSNPHSPSYGKFMTRQQVAERTSNLASTNTVLDFLKANPAVEIVKTSRYGEFVTARAPISVWEAMLSTEFFEIQRINYAGEVIPSVTRALEYQIPEALESHVSAVFKTVQLPPLSKKGRKASLTRVQANPDGPAVIEFGTVTPQLLNNYFNIFSNTGNSLSSQSVYESLNQTYSPADLTQFQTNFNLPVEAVAKDIGGFNESITCVDSPGDCGEANLDVQYMMAVAQNIPTVYFYDPDASDDTFLLGWAEELLNMPNPPLVNSISYGAAEHFLDEAHVQAFDNSAIMLSAIGVTITASSGDDGAVGSDVRDGTEYCGYYPDWPASSPYVLSVGATQGPESDSTEIACASNTGGIITSGGGFSSLYPMPLYQQEVVEGGYFSTVSILDNQPVPGYNITGRAYPDISSLGYNYYVLIGGDWYLESGTSASSPVVAAMIALVNSARLASDRGPLGWINPAMYNFSTLFPSYANDITSGDNKCAAGRGTNYNCCEQGFDAVTGWDPVTGFGSLNYERFYNYYVGPTPSNNDDSNSPLLSPEGVIAVSVVGGVVGAAAVGGVAYYAFFAHPASDLKTPLAPATQSPMV